ncbi:MULE domain-containing protein [Aphis craccivora]|uniref:MULE domain-containing protein n=1 Tax=Aphis craccivora TaxID=307492 RepID=A0A6G0VXK9_APHCR|nr:MULE domain-containing protein [Aphis craccivora]
MNNSFEVIETTKGHPLAIHDDYQYRKYQTNNANIITWVCLNEKKDEKCKGRLRTTEQGLDLVTEIPVYSSVKTTLNRIRRKSLGNALDPKLREDIIIPFDSEFVLFDDGEENRIIGLCSIKCRQIASEGKACFVDGTFTSCSKQFYQIYTIHIDIGSTNEEINIIPVIYILLPNKTKMVYERLFSMVKTHIPNFNPESFTLDFEISTIQSITQIFPSAEIHGCNYHFNQALWRKIQNIGLASTYKDNADIRLHVRMCCALAHIPISDIDEGWIIIMSNTPDNDKLTLFYDYFIEQWLENPIISRGMWNCHKRRHRTNNIVEGWNSKLNKLLNTPRPTFMNLYSCLKKETENAELLYERSYLNMEGKRRKKCTYN